MRSALAAHVLSVVANGPDVTIYRLGPDRDTGMGVTRLVFTHKPRQIVITGDLHPGVDNGVVGTAGYGAGWFSQQLSEDYLCEKFLRRGHVPEKAREWMIDHALQLLDESRVSSEQIAEQDFESPQSVMNADDAERFTKIDEALEAIEDAWHEYTADVARSAEAFYEFYCDVTNDSPDGENIGYDPSEAGWLCAIQQRFAEIFVGASQ